MQVASALVSGLHPAPELADAAVRKALDKAGLHRADQVVLFLSRHFSRHAPAAITAAARAAQTTQISGSTTSGLLTEDGWQIDQPAAAALVLAFDEFDTSNSDSAALTLSFSGHRSLPFDWQFGSPRAGLLDLDATTWSHGRLADNACSEIRWPGLRSRIVKSSGLRALGSAQAVEFSEGYELRRIGGQTARENLQRSLPPDLRELVPLHQIAVLRENNEPGVPILSANADGSLTLACMLVPGEAVRWAIRQALFAEQEMREALATVNGEKAPDFALMFSCIGRGPVFYGDDDRDLNTFRRQFPNTPLLGAYGSGQLVPTGARNCLFQNTVVTLLFESTHV